MKKYNDSPTAVKTGMTHAGDPFLVLRHSLESRARSEALALSSISGVLDSGFPGVTEMTLFTRLEFLDVILFAPILKPFIGMRSQAGFVPLY
jgi:hypothetical protein